MGMPRFPNHPNTTTATRSFGSPASAAVTVGAGGYRAGQHASHQPPDRRPQANGSNG